MKAPFKSFFWRILCCCVLAASGAMAQWVEVFGLPGGRIEDACAIDSALFMAINGQLFHAEYKGATWTPLTPPEPNLEVYSIEARGEFLLAGTRNGVYQMSGNSGKWEPFQRPGLPVLSALSIWSYLGHFFIGSEGVVYKSIDQGETWHGMKMGLPPDARVICFAGIVKIAVAGSESHGIFITESQNWIPSSSLDTVHSQIQELEVYGNKVFAVTKRTVMESLNLGDDWLPSSLGLADITTLLGRSDYLMAGTKTGIRLTTDNGKTWQAFDAGMLNPSSIQSLVELNGILFASTESGVWRMAASSAGIQSHRISNHYLRHARGRQNTLARIDFAPTHTGIKQRWKANGSRQKTDSYLPPLTPSIRFKWAR
jgi:hypothetical protein